MWSKYFSNSVWRDFRLPISEIWENVENRPIQIPNIAYNKGIIGIPGGRFATYFFCGTYPGSLGLGRFSTLGEGAQTTASEA